MSSTPDKCPRCGSEFVGEGVHGGTSWKCGSFRSAWPVVLHRSDLCRLREAHALLRRIRNYGKLYGVFLGTNMDAEIERVLNGDAK